jgi:hypothetical protein
MILIGPSSMKKIVKINGKCSMSQSQHDISLDTRTTRPWLHWFPSAIRGQINPQRPDCRAFTIAPEAAPTGCSTRGFCTSVTAAALPNCSTCSAVVVAKKWSKRATVHRQHDGHQHDIRQFDRGFHVIPISMLIPSGMDPPILLVR